MGLTIKIKIKRQVRRYDALGVLLMSPGRPEWLPDSFRRGFGSINRI